MKKLLLIGGLLLCCFLAVAVLAISAARSRNEAAFAAVEEHLAEHQAELSDAVRAVLAANPAGARLPKESLPAALKGPGVNGAFSGEGHVTLFVYSNPDVDRGFRVWAGEQTSDFADTPTSLAGVYRFRYCDDHADSPSNRPD